MENDLIVYDAPKADIVASNKNYKVTVGDKTVVLKRDVDFGMIRKKDGSPISQRPTLYKSGAHKILTLFGLAYLTELVGKHADYQNGFFYYEFKATAYFDGHPVRTGYGCANTSESSGGLKGGFDLANTKMKIAEKRAEVDLAIKLADASAWFTQDLEDTTLDKQAGTIISEEAPITAKQQTRLFAIAGTYDISREKAKQLLASWGYASTKDIKMKDYDAVCEKMERYGKGEQVE